MTRASVAVTAALAAILASASIAAAQTRVARPPLAATGGMAGPSALARSAPDGARLRVIVGLSVPFAPEGLLAAGDRLEQRRDIAAAQRAVELDVPAGMSNVKRFTILPALAAEVDAAALTALMQSPLVAFIERDELARPSLVQSTRTIGADAVWAQGFEGANVAVAVLDTGVDRDHPTFGGRVASEACYSTTSPGVSTSLCPGGQDEQLGPRSAAPCRLAGCGHGTHVAGIVAGSSSGARGVAPAARIVAIQVFSSVSSTTCSPDPSPCALTFTSDQLLALQRVYELRHTLNIAAVNMSFGGGAYASQAQCDAANTSRKDMIDTLRAAGVATVIASGNDAETAALSAPGCISSAISVGASGDGSASAPADRVASFSNSAPFLSLLAPGQSITSAVPGTGTATMSGTSMAAPHVAGAWAVLKSRVPGASVSQVLDVLQASGVPLTDARNGLVKPRLHLEAAMAAIAAPCTYTLSPATVSVPATGGTATVTVTTQAGCPWSLTPSAGFVSVPAGTRTGSGSLTFTVAPNPGGRRSATIAAGGQSLLIVQEAAAPHALVDLNGDGHPDLLWQHQSAGHLAAWLMSGTTMVDGVPLSPAQVLDTGWKVAGAGDLDGDGHVDLVWQHDDGRVSGWLMDGRTLRRGNALSTPRVDDLRWRIRAVGDMDRDGRADLLWQHGTSGALALWTMNGLTVLAGVPLSPAAVADTEWTVKGLADFNRDGSLDILWRHGADGRIAVWFMSGLTMISGTLTSPSALPDAAWDLRAAADFTGDGYPDLVWHHSGDGRVAVWVMNGLAQVQGFVLAQVADTDWRIVGPR